MEAAPTPSSPTSAPASAPPGDLAIWFFILAELLAFGVFFAAYAFGRAHNVELFNEMQLTLNRPAGALNTVLLITASWCVARGVEAVSRARPATGARWLAATRPKTLPAGVAPVAVGTVFALGLNYADHHVTGEPHHF